MNRSISLEVARPESPQTRKIPMNLRLRGSKLQFPVGSIFLNLGLIQVLEELSPLSVSSNHRYIQDAWGHPFFLVGDIYPTLMSTAEMILIVQDPDAVVRGWNDVCEEETATCKEQSAPVSISICVTRMLRLMRPSSGATTKAPVSPSSSSSASTRTTERRPMGGMVIAARTEMIAYMERNRDTTVNM